MKIISLLNIPNDSREEYKKIFNLLSKIKSEYIIKYYEYYMENDSLYIIMEYGGDYDLKKVIENHKNKEEFID